MHQHSSSLSSVPHEGFFRNSRSPALAWLVAICVYGPLALWVTYRFREKFNEDAVFYIRRAYYLTHGLAWDSVSAYWSPLLSWCIAPFFYLHRGARLLIDPVHAAHLVLAIWGGLFILAVDRLFRTLLDIPWQWRAAALLCIALLGVFIEIRTITPDELLGALLAFYFSFAAQPNFLGRRRTPFFAGLVGGLCYLCKAYGLPFVLLHHTCNCAYRGWLTARAAGAADADARRAAAVKALRAWLLGLLGFAILALPWITVLSVKYQRPVFSTNKAFNHLAVGPPEIWSKTDFPDNLNMPKDPFITANEVVDLWRWPNWSPFDSWRNFTWQLEVTAEHATQALGDIWAFDHLGISLAAIAMTLAAVVVSLRLGRASPLAFPAVEFWIVGTAAIYLSGFMIVAYENRYMVPVLIPLAMALVLRICWHLARRGSGAIDPPIRDAGDFAQPAPSAVPNAPLSPLDDWASRHSARRWASALVYVSLACFFGSMVADAWPFLTEPGVHRPLYRQVAERMTAIGLGHHRFASTETPRGACVAYFLNEKFMPFPWDMDLANIEQKLSANHITTLIVWRHPGSLPWLREGNALRLVHQHRDRWRHALRIRMGSELNIDIYVRRHHRAAHKPA